MEKFIQEVLVVFAVLAAVVILFYAIAFLLWVLLGAVIVTVIYRLIKWVVRLFRGKKPIARIDDL